MHRIDALVWIYPPILVHEDLAGTSYEVTISGRQTTLTLPLDGGSVLYETGPQRPTEIRTFPPPDLARALSGSTASGTIGMSAPVGFLVVDCVRLQWDDPEFEQAAMATDGIGTAATERADEVGYWFAVVDEWIAVWHLDIREEVTLPPRPAVRFAFTDRPQALAVSGGGPGPPIIRAVRITQEPVLRAAFTAASKDLEVPLAHGLLYEARLHAAREDYRLCVISSCSAAEVALSSVARARLRSLGHSVSDTKDILKNVSGIVELYRLAATSTTTLSVSIGRVMSQLANPRNRATHAGEFPDRDTAAKAYQTAVALVALAPGPTVQEILEDPPEG